MLWRQEGETQMDMGRCWQCTWWSNSRALGSSQNCLPGSMTSSAVGYIVSSPSMSSSLWVFMCACVFQKIQQHLHTLEHNTPPSCSIQWLTTACWPILPQTCLEQKLPETMPYHLPFMRPGAETTELGALYLRVRKVMVDVHERRAKMKSLIHIAEEW